MMVKIPVWGLIAAVAGVVGGVVYLLLRDSNGGCTPEASRKCDPSTKTWWKCTSGEWVNTGESCEGSDFISSLRFTVHYDGTTTPVIGAQVTMGSLGAKLTDALGQVTFTSIPKDVYSVFIQKDGFHLREYSYHAPRADYITVDLTTTQGTGDYDYPLVVLQPIVPDERYSVFFIQPSNVVGASGQSVCNPLGSICCSHQPVSAEFQARDAWQEPIAGLPVLFSLIDTNYVCFTASLNPAHSDEWDMWTPARDVQCNPLLYALPFQMTKTDADGIARAYLRANNNNNFTQRVATEGRYVHPVTGESKVITLPDLFFGFNKCAYAQTTCYENTRDVNNSGCP